MSFALLRCGAHARYLSFGILLLFRLLFCCLLNSYNFSILIIGFMFRAWNALCNHLLLLSIELHIKISIIHFHFLFWVLLSSCKSFNASKSHNDFLGAWFYWFSVCYYWEFIEVLYAVYRYACRPYKIRRNACPNQRIEKWNKQKKRPI